MGTQLKQVRKLRWSVAFVILQNCDLLTHSVSNISSPRSVCCEAATDKNYIQQCVKFWGGNQTFYNYISYYHYQIIIAEVGWPLVSYR